MGRRGAGTDRLDGKAGIADRQRSCRRWLVACRVRSATGRILLATGHYARRVEADGRLSIARSRDGEKDQTYFLFGLTQAQLAGAIFPLGEFTKEQTREYARKLGLPTADLAAIAAQVKADHAMLDGVRPDLAGAAPEGGGERQDPEEREEERREEEGA